MNYNFETINDNIHIYDFLKENFVALYEYDNIMNFSDENIYPHPMIEDFYKNQKTLFTDNKTEKDILFSFESDNFSCELYTENHQIVLKRNDKKVELSLDEMEFDHNNETSGMSFLISNDGTATGITLAIGLYKDSLSLSLFSQAYKVIKKLNFDFNPGIESVSKTTSDTFELDGNTKVFIKKLKDTIEAKKMHKTKEELINSVRIIMNTLSQNIYMFGGHTGFWDKDNPKLESDSQQVLSYMIGVEVQRVGLELHRESNIPSGNIDFYINGYVENIGLCGICIEVKNAHSAKLVDGLSKQLPEYVKRKNALFGIYLVLWFNDEKKTFYNNYKDNEELISILNNKKDNELDFNKYIKVYGLDVSKPIQASKL